MQCPRGVREPRTRCAGVALTRCDPCLDGRSNLSLAAMRRGVALTFILRIVRPPGPTHAQRRSQSPSRRTRVLLNARSLRSAAGHAEPSSGPQCDVNPSPRVILCINVMVLCPYSKSFFGQFPRRDHTHSGWARTSARAMPARSDRAGAAIRPAAENTCATSSAAPAPSSTTRRPPGPMSRSASRLSAR